VFQTAEVAGQLTRIPTGDGMALVFSTTPDAPVRCALGIAKALKSRPNLRVRMGIHSGPVSAVNDVNDRSNIAGGGIVFSRVWCAALAPKVRGDADAARSGFTAARAEIEGKDA